MSPHYGISLLHRHFEMNANEVLVERDSVSTPWPMPLGTSSFMGGHISPRSWLYDRDGATLRPYEFSFHVGDKTPVVEGFNDFVSDLHVVLEAYGLTSLLGLSRLRPEDYIFDEQKRMEKTFGRANMIFDLPNSLFEQIGKETATALWLFKPSGEAGIRTMVCFSGCNCGKQAE